MKGNRMVANNPAVSVVIPVYNQEKYVGKCIRSVLGQSFQDFEIIVVNDGSRDKSLKICQKFAAKDKRIKIIDKANEGVAQARKDGLTNATGEFMLFLDSDDYLEPDALEIVFRLAKEKAVDAVAFNCDIVFDNWGVVRKDAIPYKMGDQLIAGNRVCQQILGFSGPDDDYWKTHVAHSLYMRCCLIKAMNESEYPMFPCYNEGEDAAFLLAIAPFVSSIWISNDVLYHYRYGGITSFGFKMVQRSEAYFDNRVECCLRMGMQSELFGVLKHYSSQLMDEVASMIYRQDQSEQEIRSFVSREFHKRRIAVWAQQHVQEIPMEIKKKYGIMAVANRDVDAFLEAVRERITFLRKHHYWKMRIVGFYQRMVDVIGSFC